VTLSQLYDLLLGVDWHYGMADDPRAYRSGMATVRHARGAASALGEAGMALFNGFQMHYAQIEDPPPLPRRPVE